MDQLSALLITLLIESALLVPVLRYLRWGRERSLLAWLAVVCAASLLTHPVVWWLIVENRSWLPNVWSRAIVVEGAVCVVEGLYYAWILPTTAIRGLFLGVLANVVSFGLGVVGERWFW